MRNPMTSWDKSDSYYDYSLYIIGENDMQLAQKLIKKLLVKKKKKILIKKVRNNK